MGIEINQAPSLSWHETTHEDRVERWENVQRVFLGLDEHARTKHFDMEHWILSNDCGTVGCIAGHCALDPYFQGIGLRPAVFHNDGKPSYYEGNIPRVSHRLLGSNGFDRVLRYADFRTGENWNATPTWEQMKPILANFIEELKVGKITRADWEYDIVHRDEIFGQDGLVIERYRA